MAEPTQPSAPPVIRIKRKRDDTPLDSLYLERGKRRATEHTYVFKRLGQDLGSQSVKQEYDDNGIPKVRSTTVDEEKRDPFALGKSAAKEREKRLRDDHELLQPRRFHLARLGAVRPKSRGGDVATFVERRGRMHKGDVIGVGPVGDEQMGEKKTFKRPSTKARVLQKDPMKTEISGPDPELSQKMDQWSQETSQKEEEEKAVADASMTLPVGSAMEVDNEADYVYDTYYRHLVPANSVPDEGISFGHLVIGEDEQELWETYIEDNEEEDREFDTDDEDSNAEDYYGADYPEEEVASDDEYDRDAYQYRKGASDNEEYDLADDMDEKIVHSDDEEDGDLSDARAWRRDFAKLPPGVQHGDVTMDLS